MDARQRAPGRLLPRRVRGPLPDARRDRRCDTASTAKAAKKTRRRPSCRAGPPSGGGRWVSNAAARPWRLTVPPTAVRARALRPPRDWLERLSNRMLALDDGAMCRVLIAATAISPAELPEWLERLVGLFEKMPRDALSRSAIYTRRYRARLKAGQLVLRDIVVDEAVLVAGLVGLGLLDPLRADDRKALTAAAGRALQAICETSRHDGVILDMVRTRLCLSALRRREPVRGPRLSSSGRARPRSSD